MKKCNNAECNNKTRNTRLFCSIKCLQIDNKIKNDERELLYNKNPKKCILCDEIIPYSKKENNFCNSNCAASFNNTKRKGKYEYHLSEQGLENIKNNFNNAHKIQPKSHQEKINFYLKKPKLCLNCNKIIDFKYKKRKFCCNDCKDVYVFNNMNDISKKLSNSLKNFYKTDNGIKNKKKLSLLYLGREFSGETKLKLSISGKNRCSDINERIRLKEIGRKGGFGKKGYTNNGIYYQSNFEKECFEYLEKNDIFFVPHKSLPNSSKICDIYFPNKNIWIELDGINREKRKEWLGKDYDYWLDKLNEYQTKKLNFKIFYNYKEFIKFISHIDE